MYGFKNNCIEIRFLFVTKLFSILTMSFYTVYIDYDNMAILHIYRELFKEVQ